MLEVLLTVQESMLEYYLLTALLTKVGVFYYVMEYFRIKKVCFFLKGESSACAIYETGVGTSSVKNLPSFL